MAEFELKPSDDSIKQFSALKKELKELKAAQTTAVAGSEEWNQYAKRIGEIKDEFKAANEQAKIFEAGTSFEASSNALRGMKQGILDLDFSKARESALAFQTVVQGISAAEVKQQMVDLGATVSTLASTAVTGLGKIGQGFMAMVPSMEQNKEQWKGIGAAITKNFGSVEGFGSLVKGIGSKVASGFGAMVKGVTSFGAAAMKVGLQLLVNPIFLLATAITLIVVALVALLNKFGILTKILDVMMAPLNALVAGFEALTDWMGFTENGAKDAAEAQIAASEETVARLEAQLEMQKKVYDVTKDLSDADLQQFEEITGIKAQTATDLWQTERDLAYERATAAAAEAERVRIEEGAKSEAYAEARKKEQEALNKIDQVEQQYFIDKAKRFQETEKLIENLRAGSIANEQERAKAFLKIQEEEALGKLQAKLREAKAALKIDRSEENVKAVENLEEAITLTKQQYEKSRNDIDVKAKEARQKQAKDEHDKAVKAAEERAKKILANLKQENANKLAILQAGSAAYLEQYKKGLLAEYNATVKNNDKIKLTAAELVALKIETNKKIRDAQLQFDLQNIQDAAKTRILELENSKFGVAEREELRKIELQQVKIEQQQLLNVLTRRYEDQQKADAEFVELQKKTYGENSQQYKDALQIQTDNLVAYEQETNKITFDGKKKIGALNFQAFKDEMDYNAEVRKSTLLTAETAVSAAKFDLDNSKGSLAEKLALLDRYNKTVLAQLDEEKRTRQAAIDDEIAALKKRQENAEAGLGDPLTQTEIQRYKTLQTEKEALDEEFRQKKLTADTQAAELESQIRLEAYQKGLEEMSKYSELATQGLQSVQAVSDAVFATRQNQLNEQQSQELQALESRQAAELKGYAAGTAAYDAKVAEQKAASADLAKKQAKDQEDLAKKQFKINKSMQLANAIVDGFKAVTASLASAPVAIGAVPNPVGIASLACAITTSLANIAKIAATQYGGAGAGGGPSAASPNVSSAGGGGDTATPSINLFGGGNNANTEEFGKPKSAPTFNVIATVSETDMTATQRRVAAMQANAEL